MESSVKISPLEIIQQIYSDFDSGNIPGVLDALSKKIQWTDAGHVADLYVGLRDGKASVADFFNKLNQYLEFSEFEPKEFIAKGKKVVVNGYCAGTARKTGKAFSSDWSMTWRVGKKGKVTEHHLYLDTHSIAVAMGL